MHGNVWEWVEDLFDSDYYQNSPTTDPPGPPTGSLRVLRGGDFLNAAGYARSAYRGSGVPGNQGYGLGFRLVRTAL